ncbi:STM4014 family protein [Paenibacillus hamazuiensis]|uniref:STM4014 family protein n=1 Tax=Paenibacillus hamazuiensis TaxID=2936508 RepID=UPI0030845049
MILIGNPDNRRTAGLQRARAKLGLSPAVVVPYLELLEGRTSLTEAANRLEKSSSHACAPSQLRLDAPGENFAVERALLALGAPDAAQDASADRLLPFAFRSDPNPLTVKMCSDLREQRGRLYHPSQWFRGFGRLLARLESEAAGLWPGAKWQNAPADIIGMFDKRHTHQTLTAAGVPVPRLLAPPAELPDYETLCGMMLRMRMHRVFVKLASGSGACGVVAYQVNPATGAESAVTCLGVEHFVTRPPIFYNAKKLFRYTDRREIRVMINWLLGHGAHVEQWIAKASYGERTFDIRQLVVDGAACHTVARVSRSPITNLHLGSTRMNPEDLKLSPSVLDAVKKSAAAAAASFPDSRVAGVDVLIGSGNAKPYVLDINPFGDLLYHVMHQGMDPYEWEVRQLQRL